MAWGTVTIGGIPFREEVAAGETSGTLSINGQESSPPSMNAAVRMAHANVRALSDRVVPVTFTDKSELTGFYRVTSARSDFVNYANGAMVAATWALSLETMGTERDVEFESRVPTIARSTQLAGTSVSFWHAAPVGATSYLTGTTVPASSVVRTSAEGDLLVQRGIPTGVAPRWTVPAAAYLLGSPRVLLDGRRYAGELTIPFTTWEVNNGLVRLTPDVTGTPGIKVACFAGGLWESEKVYRFTVGGVAMTGIPDFTILRNDPEEVTVRLSWAQTTGRVQVDLGLRRGSRFLTGMMKRHAAATLGITRSTAEAASTFLGGIRATAADTDGNRYVLGSSRTITAGSSTISKASVTAFDFFVGHEVGTSPAAGDAAADLMAQYLGTTGDRTRMIRR